MAVEEDGFAAPAIKRRTSDARNLSESPILIPKCRKHIMKPSILRGTMLGAKRPPGPPRSPRAKNGPPKVTVSLESGVNFKIIAKM